MKFNCGDQVYWKAVVGKVEIERAGTVVAIVPPNADPHDYTPDGMYCKIRGLPRSTESYLIQIPDVDYVFWPHTSKLVGLSQGKHYVLNTQPKAVKHYIIKKIDRSDRAKLVALAIKLGDKIVQTKDMIEVYAWGKRFWFSTERGVEFIYSIDVFP